MRRSVPSQSVLDHSWLSIWGERAKGLGIAAGRLSIVECASVADKSATRLRGIIMVRSSLYRPRSASQYTPNPT